MKQTRHSSCWELVQGAGVGVRCSLSASRRKFGADTCVVGQGCKATTQQADWQRGMEMVWGGGVSSEPLAKLLFGSSRLSLHQPHIP